MFVAAEETRQPGLAMCQAGRVSGVSQTCLSVVGGETTEITRGDTHQFAVVVFAISTVLDIVGVRALLLA